MKALQDLSWKVTLRDYTYFVENGLKESKSKYRRLLHQHKGEIVA